ncbi:acetoacetyl-CoA reductase [Corynebacterium suranareeae]|uniref:3-oxoacyl-[acyl-carrier-protein] reductase MabA n=1 Tax=Corynebacterium suranareeae TaxID=2506452 RepID=A0A160PQD7_9CORY|nr:SDR family NAD(P)-dependent oxidoreductase [Corynebacterium suranareeae]BAU94440.1 acetoacetyl-CoA reductase [Corynebacterium suranareeae]
MTSTSTPTGKLAAVTGGASGIGLASVERLHADGHGVIIIDRSMDAHEVAARLSTPELPVVAKIADLSSAEDIARVTAEIDEEFGGVDILVNNAGIHPKKPDGGHFPIEDITLDQWNLVMDVNMTATFLLSQWAMKAMTQKGWGRIVNVASRAGRMYMPISGAHYAASKAAVISFTRYLAGDCGPFGVTANTVAPGRIKTPLSDVSGLGSSQNLHEEFAKSVPLRRVGRSDELAAAVSFLASEDSSFITGSVVDVNGGIFG